MDQKGQVMNDHAILLLAAVAIAITALLVATGVI